MRRRTLHGPTSRRRFLRNRVHCPIWGLVPNKAGNNILLAILVEITYGNAFAAKLGIQLMFLETRCGSLFGNGEGG